MKSGSGDDPFADSPADEDEEPETPDSDSANLLELEQEPETSLEPEMESDTEQTTAQTIPYKFRRNSVKEDRKQRPIFLREHVEGRESEFLRTLEDDLGEEVYKTDALEAALIVAMDNPSLVAEELRSWGYDWE